MAVLKMADAADPGQDITGVDVVAMYAGGNTPHVASVADWDRQSARYRLPIWTRSHPQGGQQASADAAAFVHQLGVIGAPKGTLVALDFEMAVDGAYVQQFDLGMRAAGHPVALYGSRSYVRQNPQPKAPGGYWDALWDGVAHLDAGSIGTQYASDGMLHTDYDLSEIAAGLPLWDTHGAPDPLPPVVHPADTAQQRATHNPHTPIAVDGSFGPATIEALQYVLGVAVDGSFGQHTKTALQELLGVKADGDVGPLTVMALQRAVGATADGQWGRQTTSHLQGDLNGGTFW